MARTIRVPWYSWQRFRVRGVVRERNTGRPLAGYRVAAFDQDVIADDFLGDCLTDAEGGFEIRFLETDFKDALEVRPDLYLQVFAPDSSIPVADTESEVRHDAGLDEYFEIGVSEPASTDASTAKLR